MSPLVKPVSLLSRPAPLIGSLSFDGNNDGLRILDGAQTGLDLAGDFTLECWIKWDSLPTPPNYAWIFSKDGVWGAVSGRAYFLTLYNNAGQQQLWVMVSQNGVNMDWVTWNVSPSTGAWYHVAVTCDISQAVATQHECFVNTVSQGNGTVTANAGATSIVNSASPFSLAYEDFDDAPVLRYAFMSGHLADVRVWNVIRTQPQIAAAWKTPLVGNESGLVGNWRLDDGSGTTAADTGPNGNTLSFVDAPTWTADVPY